MRRKSLFPVGGLVCAGLAIVVGIAGCHALPKVVTEKQLEITLESTNEFPVNGVFSGLARSGDGRVMAITKDNKKTGLWHSGQESKDVQVLETGENEWVYSPTLSPDGSTLATVSNTPRNFQSSGHLLLWDPGTGQRLASVDNISWPVCCASFNPDGTLIGVAGNTTLYLISADTREIVQRVEMERVVNGVI